MHVEERVPVAVNEPEVALPVGKRSSRDLRSVEICPRGVDVVAHSLEAGEQ